MIPKGAAPVPSRTVRPGDILETRSNKFNVTKRWKNKKKNKFSEMEDQLHQNFELSKDSKVNMMNSNRVIEPFSPTFEHPEDFAPSNQTSFRPIMVSKWNKNLDSSMKDENIIPAAIFNGTEKVNLRDSKIIDSNIEVNHADTIDFEKFKKKEKESFKETGKFINPLSETSEATTDKRIGTAKHQSEKETSRKSRRRHKSSTGRHSKRTKPNNKSEERKDMSLWHEYNKCSKHHQNDIFSAEKGKISVVSPHTKINKLIRKSLKKNKENETIRIIEQILKEEDNMLK